eukprot:955874-Pyramimonas_sp.AAC.1
MAPCPSWKYVEYPPLAAIGSALSKWVLTRTGRGRRAIPSGLALDTSSVSWSGPPRRPRLAAASWL